MTHEETFVNVATIWLDGKYSLLSGVAAVRWPMVDDGGGSSAETKGCNPHHASTAVTKNHSIAPDTCTQKTGK